jgi:hypothetical protein
MVEKPSEEINIHLFLMDTKGFNRQKLKKRYLMTASGFSSSSSISPSRNTFCLHVKLSKVGTKDSCNGWAQKIDLQLYYEMY